MRKPILVDWNIRGRCAGLLSLRDLFTNSWGFTVAHLMAPSAKGDPTPGGRPQGTAVKPGAVMRLAIIILPFFCYAILSIALFAHRWKPGYLFQKGGDVISFIWFLNWWPFALSHQLDPSTTMYLWRPTGFNLWWTTSVPTLAILGWPITASFGAVATWNILSLLAPVASAYGCFLLLTYITKDRLASLVGGLVLGFSSYLMGHMLGHLNLTFIPLVPLMVLLVLMRANGDIGRTRFVASMVACVVLQFGISKEILATAALVGVIAYAAFYPFYRKSADMHGLAVDLSVAAVISVLVVSPALYSMYQSAGTVPEMLHEGATKFSTDLVNLLVPTEISRLGCHVFGDIAARFTGNIAEQTAYLGLPLFIAIFFAASTNLRKRWMAPLLIVLLASFVLSLGPVLQINGRVSQILLPWEIINRLPVIRQALPGRLTLYAWLAISVLIGTWLASRDESGKRSLTRYCAAAISIIFLLPNPAKYGFHRIDNLRMLSSENVSKYFHSGDTIVVLPPPPHSSAMLWQIRSGMRFRIVGGYVGAAPTAVTSSAMFAYIQGAPLPHSLVGFEDTAAAFFDKVKVSSVVITPETRRPLAQALLALPWPRQTDGQSIVMKVPPF